MYGDNEDKSNKNNLKKNNPNPNCTVPSLPTAFQFQQIEKFHIFSVLCKDLALHCCVYKPVNLSDLWVISASKSIFGARGWF